MHQERGRNAISEYCIIVLQPSRNILWGNKIRKKLFGKSFWKKIGRSGEIQKRSLQRISGLTIAKREVGHNCSNSKDASYTSSMWATSWFKGKLHSKIIGPDLIDCFPLNPMVKVRGQNSKGQTDSEKKGTCERLWRRGAAPTSCKVARAIRDVCDQPESETRPAVVNQIPPTDFKTIPQPQILDDRHQWHNNGRLVVTRDLLAIFGRLFDRVPVRILTSDLHHWTLRKKKAYKIWDYNFGVQFSFKESHRQGRKSKKWYARMGE